MDTEDRSKAANTDATSTDATTTDDMATDITCGQCGKTNGNKQVGTSWICADCKVTKSV